MPGLVYNTNIAHYDSHLFGKVTRVGVEQGETPLIDLVQPYFVWFEYNDDLLGSLMIFDDHVSAMVLTDYYPHEFWKRYLTSRESDERTLESFVSYMETNGIGDNAELATFARATCGELFGPEFLEKLAKGIKFTERYHLEIPSPGPRLKHILMGRGDAYSWRSEFWEPVGTDIEIATFPAQESE